MYCSTSQLVLSAVTVTVASPLTQLCTTGMGTEKFTQGIKLKASESPVPRVYSYMPAGPAPFPLNCVPKSHLGTLCNTPSSGESAIGLS
ncbi:hypothetical protein BKA82DRAFT_1008801 [Pisolithus tinctorius]|uniref:Secreted protein n=1 Tax=Pisolithus tinctorius Marx 270 TaxID=870435 RepID=A0A0C3MXM2_PISTI|nr:hypothetical protein BKA82DRAFT_1008801 [Pisolithus tinctorius]KIN93654.1 hypothetical protein M404DRAFT_1008801 [Pisolithus tinctorius Marx 270]